MAFQSILAMLLVLVVIFMVIYAVSSICSILGIVFGCISADKSGKYVSMRGNTDYRTVKSNAAAAKAFLIVNSIILGLAAIMIIFMTVEVNTQDFEYGSMHDQYEQLENVPDLIAGFITSSMLPIGSIIACGIAMSKFKAARALKEELDSKGLKSYPLPQNPYFNVRPPYQNQYGAPYQNPYYNGQYLNQYPNQYQNQGQYPNQGYVQNQGYNQNMQTYNQTVQTANAGETQESVPAPTVKCPSCGTENSGNNRFCVNCGNTLK